MGLSLARRLLQKLELGSLGSVECHAVEPNSRGGVGFFIYNGLKAVYLSSCPMWDKKPKRNEDGNDFVSIHVPLPFDSFVSHRPNGSQEASLLL